MKRFNVLHALTVLFVFSLMAVGLVPSEVEGSVPQLINFQGVLKDGSGNPVADGNYSVTFTIYDADVGGNNLWTETQSVTTTDGLFSALLGTLTPIPDTVFKGADRYLGTAVSPDPELSPRQRLISVGYAYRVNSIDGALGGTVNGAIDAPGMSSKIRFHFNDFSEFPDPSAYHGMFAHAHNQGAAYYAHAAQWVRLADSAHPHSSLAASDLSPNPALSVDANGNVGIGTASPAAKLDVLNGNLRVGSQVTSAGIEFYPPTAGTPTNAGSIVGVGGSTNLAILPVGNVGVGTSSPTEKLDVNGGIAIRNNNSLKIFSDGVGLNFINAPGAFGTLDLQKTGDLNPSVRLGHSNFPARAFTIMTGNGTGGATERITVLPTGEVGIGTTSPAKLLTIQSNASDYDLYSSGTGGFDITTQAGTGGAITISSREASSAGITISTSNKVGIGTNTPSKLLTIQADEADFDVSTSGSGGLDITTQGGTGGAITISSREASSSGIAISTSNRVGIGTTVPNSKLQVNGSFAKAVLTTSSDITLTDGHSIILGSPIASGNVVVNLPPVSGCTGRLYAIKNIQSSGTVTVDANGSELIDGSATVTLFSLNRMTIVSDGATWWIVD